MNARWIGILLLTGMMIAAAGCSKKELKESYSSAYSEEQDMDSRADKSRSDEGAYGGTQSPQTTDVTVKQDVMKNRKLIKTGRIDYLVNDLGPVEGKILVRLNELGGYTESSDTGASYARYVVKIPADRFEKFLSITSEFGKITSRNISAEDVTRSYFDLEQRIKTRRILLEKYQSYLRSARNVEELLKIEAQINQVTSEIESMEGNFKNMEHQISYSTLTLNFSVPGMNEVVRNFPSLEKGFKDFGYALVNFLYVILLGVFYVAIFGSVIVALIALFYWLTFGKIGLIKRLFKILSGK